MDRFNPFDPRYQLEAEDLGTSSAAAVAPRSIHDDIHHALHALDALAARLRHRSRDEQRPRH